MFGEITNKQGERLDYTFHSAPDSKWTAVIGHGVTGNKDRPFIAALAEGLSQAGISALRFSFSGNGASGGRFVDSNISKEVEDLGSVLDALEGRAICYIGHSMGAAVGVLRASRDPRIQLLISLAGMVHTREFARREFGGVKPDEGFMWDEPACPLSKAFMDDLNKIGTVSGHAQEIRVPWLFIHGSADDVVPLRDSLDIHGKANEPKELYQIPGANHVFADAATQPMVRKAVEWIQRQSGGRPG